MQFATNAEVNPAATFWLQTLDTDLLCLGTEDLVSQWAMVTEGKSGVYHLQPMCLVYVVGRISFWIQRIYPIF